MSIEETKQQNQELEELYKKFDDNFKKLSIDSDNEIIDKFTELAEKIVEYNNIDCLKFLLQYFHDDDEGYNSLYWLQETLRSIIGIFREEIYVKGLLNNLHLMLPHAQKWAMRMINNIMGVDQYNKLLIENIHLADKNLLKQFFDNMFTEGYAEYEEINILIHRLK